MVFSLLPEQSKIDLINRSENIFDVKAGRSAFFKKSFLQNRDWAVLLYECDFKYDATRVALACEKLSYLRASCFNIGYVQDLSYNIDLCEGDLFHVHEVYCAPSYVIIEEEERFAIVSDSDYYWSIAGDKSFLSQIAFPSIKEELELFRKGIDPYITSKDSHNKSIGYQMLAYLKICSDVNNQV